jgi:hypothetical protein
MMKQINWMEIIKIWWLSVLLIPFIGYHIHQAYLVLNYNIFFSISYSFPFPINIEKFLMSNFLLIVHEAGHTFFSVFGNRIVTILGGSLNEILFSLIILGYFLINKIPKGVQFAFYLLGSAWFSIAYYAADASQRQLPLIGNLGKEAHDWHNLLRHWNWLEYDSEIGLLFVAIGTLCYATALSVPLWMKKYESVKLDLKL